MKKSIVAMLSITALAAVANAETWSGTDGTHFEGTTVGNPFYGFLDDSGNNTGPFFWFAATNNVYCESQFGTYTNSADLGTYTGDRPAIAGQAETTNKCLAIETDGGRLYRGMAAGAAEGATDTAKSLDAFTQHDVTSSIYFDSLVQFTVNEDDDPQVQTGDKLVVWLKGDEANQTTNLVVKAGWLDDQGGLTPTNYVISTSIASIEPGTWHRLTIETFKISSAASAQPLGFRVFIDGAVVSSEEGPGDVASYLELSEATMAEGISAYVSAKTLFPSLVDGSGSNANALSCVAFEGTGAIDDLTFTDTNPFGSVEPAGPTIDGEAPANAAAFIAGITTGTLNILPIGWTLNGNQIVDNNGIDYGDPIPAFYTPTLTDGTLTLELNTTALPTIGAANVEEVAKEAIEVAATTFTATLTGTNTKLYYGLKVATSPNAAEENWTLGELKQGTGGAMQLTADKPTENSAVAPAAFFKVYVTDIAPASAQGE